MGMPLDVSDFLANLHGDDTKPDEDPDWLKELDDGDGSKEVSEKQGSQSSDDPFAFLSTPSKTPSSQQPSTPVTATPAEPVKHQAEAASTPKARAQKGKAGAAAAGVAAPGRVTIKNPDKITFNRLLVELPHKDSDGVDLSGDTGAVGRFTFCDRVCKRKSNGDPAVSDPESGPEAPEPPSPPGSQAGRASDAAGDDDNVHNGEVETEEGLVLDLKGVKFDARLAALAGTACVVNIGPSGAKVEAVFNEFLQLDESSLFEDYEEVTAGTLEGWTLTDPECDGPSDGKASMGKKQQKTPVISSGRVSKAAKRKPSSKAGKSKTPRKTGTRKR